MRSLTPFLWFDGDVDEAVTLYRSLFPDLRVHGEMHDGDGRLSGGDIEIAGTRLRLFAGGPMYRFNEAFSLFVECEDQAEVDRLWAGLTANGGEEGRCGWCKDRFGLSWQIIPTAFNRMMSEGTTQQRERVIAAMMTMNKMDVAAFEAAYAG